MSGRMKDGEDDDCIFSDDIKDSIGKTVSENAADFRMLAESQIQKRPLKGALASLTDFINEFGPQACLPSFVPRCSFQYIRFCFEADNESATHFLSWPRILASTSPQELPAFGSRS